MKTWQVYTNVRFAVSTKLNLTYLILSLTVFVRNFFRTSNMDIIIKDCQAYFLLYSPQGSEQHQIAAQSSVGTSAAVAAKLLQEPI